MKLIVVESPGKIDKISHILGDDYKVVASYGHIRDLDSKNLSIDVNNNFEPFYIVTPEKNKVVQNLRYNQSICDEVIIASDLDREGEMIACSIMEVLKLFEPKRIVFNEITKKAITTAVENPGKINMDMVYAQQARRLLDRLVGYKISPLLWKQLEMRTINTNNTDFKKNGTLSAGRVQSVVVRIIIDMENEIKSYQTNPYFKTVASFSYNDTVIPCVLMEGKNVYKIETKEKIVLLLESINKKTISKVVNVSEKLTNKSPPAPHITSSLMQEASTRHNMSSKRTMETAQKLFDKGYITYMRTDSTMISKDAIASCKEYINTTFGDNYYKYRVFKTKSKDAQEAHEAIRPTKFEVTDVNDMGDDCMKLYKLIWKRTVASLMMDACINVQTIDIDCLNGITSILDKNVKFSSTYETTVFDGYMILYSKNDIKEEESSETNNSGKLDITIDTIVNFISMDISEEYTKPPLRYNEAGLIKYLKNNGIGRPSTYASIISKVIERNYIVIKNIDGEKKDVTIYSITNKTYGKIKEKSKTISVGKENMKIIPTDIGIMVNDFMMKNFEPIMDIKFTADVENMLDKIANGKVKWFNVLDKYYKMFSPMVEKLEKEVVEFKTLKIEDKMIGVHPVLNLPIFLTKSKFGYCIKIMEGEKWRYGSIEENKPQDITLEMAVNFLEYPKTIGKIGTSIVSLNKGKFGLYFKVGAKCIAIKDTSIEPTLEYAKQLASDSNVFKIKNKTVHLKNGQYGYYLMIMNGTKKPTNIPVPKNINISSINVTVINTIIEKNKTRMKFTKKEE